MVWSVPSAGWELVRLEQLHDVQVLLLKGDCHWGSVQVVEDSGVDKDVQKMAGALGGSLSAGQEQCRLTLGELRTGVKSTHTTQLTCLHA